MRTLSKVITISMITLIALSAGVWMNFAYALPDIDKIENGSANINTDNATRTMTIDAGPQTIINYKSFNILENERVIVNLPSQSDAILNRVTGPDASNLMGYLRCNGTFILVNTNGINIGPNATLDVGSIIASTRDITNSNFISAKYIFEKNSQLQKDALLLNQGKINIAQGGFGVLIAGAVENRGTIIAPLGTIALAGADMVTLTISDNGMISIAIDKATASQVYDIDGSPITKQINNTGTIIADGGVVLLKAESLPGLFEKTINVGGYVRADKVVDRNGTIMLISSGDIETSTTMEAPIVEIDKKGADLVITNSTLDNDLITIEGPGLKVTYLMTTSLTLKSDEGVNTTAGAIIQASQVTLVARKFGTLETPVVIDADKTYINRIEGDIDIRESLGIGTSVLIRGPPDGFGAIIYPQRTDLSLYAPSGNIYVSSDINARSINLESVNGNITVTAALAAPDGTVRLWTAGHMDLRYSTIISKDGRFIYNPEDGMAVIWTGAALDNSWENGNNWNPFVAGGPDGAGYDVTIDLASAAVTTSTSSTHTIGSLTIGTTQTCRLTLGNTSSLTVTSSGGSSGNLTIGSYGTLNVGSNTLTIDGNLSDYGQMWLSTATINIGGNLYKYSTNSLALASSTVNIAGTLWGIQGEVQCGSTNINIGGDWHFAGAGFQWGSSTVSFIGSGVSTIYSANTFYNLRCVIDGSTTKIGKTLAFPAGTTQTINGTLSLSGMSGKPGLTGHLALQSSSGPTLWRIAIVGSAFVSYVNVTDSDATGGKKITASQSFGNNTFNWDFGLSITGRLYNDLTDSSPMAYLGPGVRLIIDGNLQDTVYTNDQGYYYFLGTSFTSSSSILVYIDNVLYPTTKQGSVVVANAYDSTSISGLDIHGGAVIARSYNGMSPITNTNFNTAKGTQSSSDILYNLMGNDLYVSSGILIWSSCTYIPGGNVFLGGNWTNNGTFLVGNMYGNYTVTFDDNFVTIPKSTISGNDSYFYDLTCETASKELDFQAGSTQTVTHTLTLNGQNSGTRIMLRSTSSGTRFNLNVTGGPQNASYVDVQDSNALTNTITTTGSKDSGNNNANWIIPTYTTFYWVCPNYLYENWTDSDNWSGSSGGPGGAGYPAAGNTAIFDFGSSYDCFLDSDVNIQELRMVYTMGSYSGTIYTHTNAMPSTPHNLVISGNLTMESNVSGTIDASTGNLQVGGDVITAGGHLYAPGPLKTFTVGGSWNPGAMFFGSFYHDNGMVTFSSTSGGKTVNTGNSQEFYDVVFSGTGGVWQLVTSLSADHSLAIQPGATLDLDSRVLTTGNLDNQGNLQNPASLPSVSVQFYGYPSTSYTIRSGGANLGNVTFNINGMGANPTWTLLDDMNVGDLTINSNTTLNAGGRDIYVGGTWRNSGMSGTFTPGTRTVYFNGSGSIYAGGTGTGKAFYNLTRSVGGAVYNYDDLEVDGAFINSAGTFYNYQTMSVAGDFTLKPGSYFYNYGTTVTVAGNFTLDSGMNFSNLGTLIFNGPNTLFTDSTVAPGQDLGNVYIGDGVTNASVTLASDLVADSVRINPNGNLIANSYTIYDAGDWTNDGAFNAGTGTVDFNGSGTQTIYSGGTGPSKAFFNLTHSGSNTLQILNGGMDVEIDGDFIQTTAPGTGGFYSFGPNMTVYGNFELNSWLAFYSPAILTVYGNFTLNSGSSFYNTGTLIFNGPNTLFTDLTSAPGQDLGNIHIGDGVANTLVTLATNLRADSIIIYSGATFNPAAGATVTGTGANSIDNYGIMKVNAPDFSTNYISFAGYTQEMGATVEYSAAGSQNIDTSLTYWSLATSGSGTKTIGDATINGNLIIGINTTLEASALSTVTFIGTGVSNISGNTIFYNFNCATPGKTLMFAAGSTQTFAGKLTLTGAPLNLIVLRSTSTGTQWNIYPQGTWDISYVDVKDSNNKQQVVIYPIDSVDSGNNNNWFTAPTPPKPPTPPTPPEPPTPPIPPTTPTVPTGPTGPSGNVDIPQTEPVVNTGEGVSASAAQTAGTISGAMGEDKTEMKLKKNYTPGKYRTVVIVYEGVVVAAPYGEKGVDTEKEEVLTAGKTSSQEGRVEAPASKPEPKKSEQGGKRVVPDSESLRGLLEKETPQAGPLQQQPVGIGGAPRAILAPEKPKVEEGKK